MAHEVGDIVYYVGEWHGPEKLPTDEDFRDWEKDSKCIVIRYKGGFIAVPFEQGHRETLECHELINCRPSVAEAVEALAVGEEVYGGKLLAVAKRLRELSAKHFRSK